MSRRTIPQLITISEGDHDLAWLKESLQWTVELEFSTLPLHLSGMWSTEQQSGEAYNLILSVVYEEMLHLGLACNMLKAIGGSPSITLPDELAGRCVSLGASLGLEMAGSTCA